MIHFFRQNPIFFGFLLLFLAIRVFWSSYLPLMEFSEARYAEMSRKILDYDDWITLWFSRDLPFWGKPPLSFWAVASSFAVLGLTEFASRLPSLLFTLSTAALIYHWIRLEKDQETGIFSAGIFLSCWLVLHTAGAVITDPALTFTTTLVMMGFWRGIVHEQKLYAYIMWVGLGLGLLTKGPIALVLCGLPCGFWVLLNNQWVKWWRNTKLFSGCALMLFVAVPWYWLAEQKTPGFIEYFIVGEHFLRFTETAWTGDLYGGVKDQPHGTIWLYLFAALLPFSPIVLIRILTKRGRVALSASLQNERLFITYLIAWFLAPAVFFTIGKNILITYVLTGIPAASVLIAMHTDDWLIAKQRLFKFLYSAALVFCFIYWAAFEFYVEDHKYNQKPIVDEYLKLNESDPGPLIYWGAPKFSVIFYTKDNVIFPGPRVSDHYDETTVYHAVRDMWAHATKSPPFSTRCQNMIYQGEYTLWYCPSIKEE